MHYLFNNLIFKIKKRGMSCLRQNPPKEWGLPGLQVDPGGGAEMSGPDGLSRGIWGPSRLSLGLFSAEAFILSSPQLRLATASEAGFGGGELQQPH